MQFFTKEIQGNRIIFRLLGIKIPIKFKKKATEYERIFLDFQKKQRFVEEEIQFCKRNWIVPDAPSFAYQVKDIFLEECYRFAPPSPLSLCFFRFSTENYL